MVVAANSLAAEFFGYAEQALHNLPLETLLPSRFRHVHRSSRIRFVNEAGPGPFAQGENFMCFFFECLLFLRGNRTVAERGAPIRCTLKDCQLFAVGGNGLNNLDSSRAGANNADPLVGEPGDRQMRAARHLNWRINRRVNAEDTELITRVQLGMQSASYVAGPLGTSEACLRSFAKKLRKLIPEARLQSPPPPGWSGRSN